MNKSLRLAVLLVPLLARWAFAGIYYEQEMKSPAQEGMGAQAHKIVCYISGAKMRVEMQGPGVNAVNIQRLDQSKFYTLFPESKMYTETPIPKLTPQAEEQVQATVTKTDETKRIGTYNCTRYEVITKGRPGFPPEGTTTQCWMTTDVDVVEEYEKFANAQSRRESSKVATEMAKVKGFPMQVVATTPDGREYMTITVTTVKKQDIPDSVFEVPADYTKATVPALEATPPAAPAPSGAGAGKGE